MTKITKDTVHVLKFLISITSHGATYNSFICSMYALIPILSVKQLMLYTHTHKQTIMFTIKVIQKYFNSIATVQTLVKSYFVSLIRDILDIHNKWIYHKHGVWIPAKWSNHTCEVVKKVNSILYLLKLLKHFNLPTEDLVTIYSGFVRPTAEYPLPLYGTLGLEFMKILFLNGSRKGHAYHLWQILHNLLWSP